MAQVNVHPNSSGRLNENLFTRALKPANSIRTFGLPIASIKGEVCPMSKTVKAFGHPIHQMLIVFPLGLLATSVIFDILYFALHDINFAVASYYTMAAGILGALVAAVFGLTDWLNITPGTRAKSVGAWHGGGNLVVTLLFLVSWFLRKDQMIPDSLSFTLSIIGVLLALVTGWLGGELVNRLGVGVDEGANPNAPSSLQTDHLPSEEWRHSH